MSRPGLPPDVIVFGPDGNCTLAICPVEYSIYGYRPSLAANITFIVLYGISFALHLFLGLRWATPRFMFPMLLGAANAILGYSGRVMLWYNPFSFPGFMIQIVCITCGPVFYTAAIYITLARAIEFFSPSLLRFKPTLLYWIFLPIDLVCLVFQGTGGALSTVSSGSDNTGVNLSLAGLALQVVAMFVFCVIFCDYLVRYARHEKKMRGEGGETSSSSDTLAASGAHGEPFASRITPRMKVFFGFMAAAFLLIFTRCVYRVAELHQGYGGNLFREQGLFIGLEGVMVITAVYCLMIGHPGFVFKPENSKQPSSLEDIEQKL